MTDVDKDIVAWSDHGMQLPIYNNMWYVLIYKIYRIKHPYS